MPRVVVVGGNAAGMSAASVAKRRAPDLEVVVVEAGEYISYSACGIPYHVGGIVTGDISRLVSVTPQAARDQRGLDVRLGTRAIAIDPRRREVTVEKDGGRWTEPYDRLVVATGTEPRLPFDGAAQPGVFAVRHLGDGIAMRDWVRERNPRTAVVIGAGYVGIEMAEAFHALGMTTTILTRSGRLMRPSFDADVLDPLKQALAGASIPVEAAGVIRGITGNGHVTGVVTEAGEYPADIVVAAAGVSPRTGLLREAGAALTKQGAVLVDDGMRTTLPDVWAAGDCVAHTHGITRQPVFLPLALPANRSGRVAGDRIAGGDSVMPPVLATAATRFNAVELARTGVTEEEASVLGYPCAVTRIEDVTKAGYFPGVGDVVVKMVAERTSGKLLGVQMVGGDGTALRINAAAVALAAGMTADALEQVDTAYAPPYSPVYDPLLIGARLTAREAARPGPRDG